MIPSIFHAFAYCLIAIAALTWLGNVACQFLLRMSGMRRAHPVSSGAEKAGHLIGWLERLIIAVGVLCHSWEVVAGVIALKTIARFKELDHTIPAEYFLVGSLFSLLWAFLISGLWLAYDHGSGLDLRMKSAGFIAPEKSNDDPKPQIYLVFNRSPVMQSARSRMIHESSGASARPDARSPLLHKKLKRNEQESPPSILPAR